MAVFQSRDDDPSGEHAENGEAKIDADADKVVCAAFGLHTVVIMLVRSPMKFRKGKPYAHATVCPSASTPRRIPV